MIVVMNVVQAVEGRAPDFEQRLPHARAAAQPGRGLRRLRAAAPRQGRRVRRAHAAGRARRPSGRGCAATSSSAATSTPRRWRARPRRRGAHLRRARRRGPAERRRRGRARVSGARARARARRRGRRRRRPRPSASSRSRRSPPTRSPSSASGRSAIGQMLGGDDRIDAAAARRPAAPALAPERPEHGAARDAQPGPRAVGADLEPRPPRDAARSAMNVVESEPRSVHDVPRRRRAGSARSSAAPPAGASCARAPGARRSPAATRGHPHAPDACWSCSASAARRTRSSPTAGAATSSAAPAAGC